MSDEKLKKHVLHSLAIYSALAGVPRALHIGDVIDSALSNNKEQMISDLESLMMNCVLDAANYLLDKINLKEKEKWKASTRSKLTSIRNYTNKLDAKTECVRIINEINTVLGYDRIPDVE